jgi:thymidylate synthase (FAD)
MPEVPDSADSTNREDPIARFRSDVTVELVKATASDADVLFAARVSTKGEQSLDDVNADASRSKGLLNYLMRDRHGCYDEATEVLTSDGWMPWPQVTGTESFCTLSADGSIEYQFAERLIAKPYTGPMVRLRMAQVDALVTPDHNLYARRRRQPHREAWELVPALTLRDACHRLRLGGGNWLGRHPAMPPGYLALLGFFVGDGYARGGSKPSFRLRKRREIDFLYAQAAVAGFEVVRHGNDTFSLAADEDFRLLAKKCYDSGRCKIIPREVLDMPPDSLREFLDGLMHSDGSVSATGKQSYSTTSYALAGQIQELALKAGCAALIYDHPFTNDDGHYGRKPRYRLTIYRDRNSQPKVGWTTEARARQVTVESYSGHVYCVTVPNGTLYVRRNGKPMWSGNSPFEHNSMTFFVSAPIFVFREFMRHRVFSYNEESGRYRKLEPVFYVPGPERKLVQEGKPGRYVFVDGTPEQHKIADEATRRACEHAYAAYLEMLEAGIAREVARGVLPVATYSSMYVTCNARALMGFLSLRTKREDSRFPSFPQREIEMVAEKMEAEWAKLMPLTHAAFNEHGRVSP